MKGKVYLVGAGPGDPGLITVKGRKCIEIADVIIYDYLASPSLLKYASPRAEIIYVGKKGGDHTLSQDNINVLIAEQAQKGRIVTRLKGGDPFIFGRGGEEVEVLVQADIPFEIIPGVTSAIAAPAYAGIPLTHRKFTSTLAFVTGHEDPEKTESSVNWNALAKGIGTVVFLMGVKNLPHITARLFDHGMHPDTPVAVIRWGTTSRQQTVVGTLSTIEAQVRAAGLKAPAIIVVGHVVSLRKTMKWFENRPLLGKRIVITRAREQASDMVARLTDIGAECIEAPTIQVIPPDDCEPLDTAIDHLSVYDWLIFTSVNGVNAFFDRLFTKGMDVRSLHHLQTAVIGPATSKRLFDFGIKSDIIPESYRAESVVEAFANMDIKDKKMLLPRAAQARPILPVELSRMGAVVNEVIAYRTKAVYDNADFLLTQLNERKIDIITFTSSSTVKNFHALIPQKDFKRLMKHVVIASIGPITADTARNLGFDVHIVAESFTIPGLCSAILKHYHSS